MVELSTMHTNQVRKRQHSGSSQRRQPAGSSSNAVYVEATSRATYQKGIGRVGKQSSATDLASRSFGLFVGDDGLVEGNIEAPLFQQHLLRHLCTSLLDSRRLVGLISGLVFGN